MSETIEECFNLPDTGGTSNNIVKTDLQSQELDLRDHLLNGELNRLQEDYLPNNNLCDNQTEASFGSEEEKGDNSVDERLTEGDTNSLNEHSTTTESSQDPPEGEEDRGEEDHLYEPEEQHSNGAFKKGRKKRISSGPGRGRPKALVTMYHSQISGDKNAIKIRIKKGNPSALPPSKRKSGRRKKHKNYTEDTDNSDYEKKPKRSRSNTAMENDVSSTQSEEPVEQSAWGDPTKLPTEVLEKIFEETCAQEGALPTLVRLCKVCRLWRDVSLKPSLWKKADLNYVKEKNRTDLRLHWLILNRLTECEDLSMGEWKVRDIQNVLEALCEHCPKLKGLNLSGWKGLNQDNIKYLSTECKTLERLDLSSINATSAINAQPLMSLCQAMNVRLTHLVLAHNKIAGFTQIVSALSSHCPNLQLLDISNIKTFAHNTALLHVEKLQSGCPKMRVLRITNSQIWLAPATLTEQVQSPGFPNLEELSLAGLEEDQTTTSRSMDDEGIERLLKTSTKLRLLDVRGCSKLTDSGLVRVPAWDLEHLFLSACYITRLQNSGLELIVQKWSHSLLEVDLAWSTATASLDAAVFALAEKGPESKLRVLNLCGSSVSLDPIKAVLAKCPFLYSINLQSCRALPRGIKRLYTGAAVDELRKSLSEKKTEGSDSEETKSNTLSPKD
ncbi:F-box/LRR-repeat protein 6 [Anthonomus grandis grandis]|uniref:F-box/LRR-repeat protein 6 n=1 Tax=Anthonomus grandis grandis TaxID=2921223 RepID=UPI002166005F|nr:F-box/LRR-repeat protein 6 [Anthonomus grandis grandis]XP_050296509.1 F-box/LRR-repeat protein 6 [Anthonomus grandis grandis]